MDDVEQMELDFSIVSPKLTVEAMRDSGYKDTDHAIAELIDNSIEANAGMVELIAIEVPPPSDTKYARARVNEIAVADDGEGMDPTTLRRALRFGDGTRLDRANRGIGRFGVGLPNASVSQCQRVDIWTWQNGADNAVTCYLDLDEIKIGAVNVPKPRHDPVPDRWRSLVESTSEPTGTLVVWTKLDRVRWRGGEKTLERTAELCGRVYRKFLTRSPNPIEIKLTLATDDGHSLVANGQPRLCLPNDPLYLICPSSTDAPFGNEPMFEQFNQRSWVVPVADAKGEIRVRCSMARPDAINEKESTIEWPRSYAKAGDAPWGKHADRNKGVSIVRAGRELELSQAWVNSYEPEERWWSVEVEFDPILDEIFGVVNNKQHVHAFVVGADFDWKEAADLEETVGSFRERLVETEDPRGQLLEVWDWMNSQIVRMRKERKKIMRGTGTSNSRHPVTGEAAEDVATNVIVEEAEQGITGSSDDAPAVSEKEKIEGIAESAKRKRVDESIAQEWAEETVYNGRRFLMKGVNLGHRDAFFAIENMNDVIQVWLNDDHPVYEHLIEVVTNATEGQTQEELADRLDKAAFTLRMLLFAWSRYEDKAPMGIKDELGDIRMDWGREARNFFSPIES